MPVTFSYALRPVVINAAKPKEHYARKWVEETLFYRSAAYRAQQLRWLEAHVFPVIGQQNLNAITPRDVLRVVEPLRETANTAESVRALIQRVFSYAIRNLAAESNPALMVRGAIVVPKKTHHLHLLEPELARFWRLIPRQGAHFTTLVAAQMLFYTMVRVRRCSHAWTCQGSGLAVSM
ncbi:MAG: hypothetical protein WA968_00225 [Castellaniella sp.]